MAIGVIAALAAAILFGASTPLAKLLLLDAGPWLLAALLYLGGGIALTIYRRLRRAPTVRLSRRECGWLIAAIAAGGIVAPVLLMYGLTQMAASSASLLLTAESVFTAVLAWVVFRENVDRRIAVGMLAIVVGVALLTGIPTLDMATLWPSLSVLGACLAWAIDNNLTRKLALTDAGWLASVKGLSAGSVNLAIALVLGTAWPGLGALAGSLLLGCVSYGVSLSLFIVGLRHLGTARTSAYFSTAPFFGAALAVLLGEPITAQLVLAGTLMATGVWLHLTERHDHVHTHAALSHEHEHVHDEHHQHDHGANVEPGVRHSHWHRHEPLRHAHPHYPDSHHQHEH
jgi:drug/metabolite transporter (DMT)-like permease